MVTENVLDWSPEGAELLHKLGVVERRKVFTALNTTTALEMLTLAEALLNEM